MTPTAAANFSRDISSALPGKYFRLSASSPLFTARPCAQPAALAHDPFCQFLF
jgi:hypothetical protein